MNRCFSRDEAKEFLTIFLPGHELEAYEALTCAYHNLDFRFMLTEQMHHLTFNIKTRKFEIEPYV